MAIGPVLIFDKSALQSLNVDEAVLLDCLFITNITPLFFVETLADLEKEMAQSNRTPEQIVGDIAHKTPVMGSSPNVYHTNLLAANLMGQKVTMRGVPMIGGGIPLAMDNKTGIIHEEFPEAEAFNRWQKGEFLDIERKIAHSWRDTLSNLNLEDSYKSFQSFFGNKQKPRTFSEAKKFVDDFINIEGRRVVLTTALDILGIPEHSQKIVIERWEKEGQPILWDFAPYAIYVFSVDLFFYISIASDLISRARPSNKVDMAYLYYLPFCSIFTSNDHLHISTAPLFMTSDQTFVKGPDLKADLKKLDEYYSALPQETKNKGVYKFATHPPTDISFLVTQLWDKNFPKWRNNIHEEDKPINEETSAEILKELREFEKNAKPVDLPLNSDKVDHFVLKRRVPLRKGKWQIMPPDVAAKLSDKDE